MFFKKWLDGQPKYTLVCVLISAVGVILSLGKWLNAFVPVDFAWIAIILCGVPIVYGAICGLIFDHDVKADVLVSLALISCLITKEFFAAGEVAFIMQIGTLLEDFTSSRTQKGIQKLIKLTPQTARILRDGQEVVVNAEEVKAGDILRVIAGESIPVDGVILEGSTTVNQAVMTGESIPVDKAAGDQITSGTVNQFGTFTMKATKACADSSLQRMIRLAQQAEAEKAPIVHLADKWATWMVFAALAIAAFTWIFTGEFLRAVTVLVVFCPCAFILATPTAILGGIGNLAKHGILVRSGDGLERLSKVTSLAFDKTGTLTYGKPEVTEILLAENAGGGEGISENISKEELLRLAAGAEKFSEHPLGKAIVSYCKKEQARPEPDVKDFALVAGKGVRALVDGKLIFAGKTEYIKEIAENPLVEVAEKLKGQGATVIFVVQGLEKDAAQSEGLELAQTQAKLLGLIALSDTLRQNASATIKKLEDQKIKCMLLTGDNKEVATFIAEKAGIRDVYANLLPEEKMQIIKNAQNGKEKVCMVGDGINDSLALATSYAGIAMGGIGSDIAVESSDAVLISDDIKTLPYLFKMSKKAMKKVFVNITLSMAINLAALTLSVLGLLTPVTGALVHNCGSVLVVLNAALLLLAKDRETY